MTLRLFLATIITVTLSSCTDLNQLQNWGNGMTESVRVKANSTMNNSHYLTNVGQGDFRTEIDPREQLEQGYWDLPSGTNGERHIIIDLQQQKINYYVGKQLVGFSPMSSGKEGYGTPKGQYKILQKDANYKSGTYGVAKNKATGQTVIDDFNTKINKLPAGCYFDPAPMPYWMRISGGYGMHVGFITGYPVSHGCIRVPEKMAKIFFENTPVGTKVTIR